VSGEPAPRSEIVLYQTEDGRKVSRKVLHRTCGGKPWPYALIPHDAIAENITLDWLVAQFGLKER